MSNQTFKEYLTEEQKEQNLIANMAVANITAETINEGEETEMTIGELFAKLEEMVLENEKNGIF